MNLGPPGSWSRISTRAACIGAIAAFMLWAGYNKWDWARDPQTVSTIVGASLVYDKLVNRNNCTRKHVDEE